jgi:DNA replication protein DnaC
MKGLYMGIMMFGAFHLTKLSIALFGAGIASRLSKPKLVRETSKLHSNNYFTLPFVFAKKHYLMRMKKSEKDYAPCKNMMFYGPPGTGKTLFAKKLAM